MTLQRQPNHPCTFFYLFNNQIERFEVAVQQSPRHAGNWTKNGSEMARFTPGNFFEMTGSEMVRYTWSFL